MEQDLGEEVQAYLEILVEQKIAEGPSPDEARRAALERVLEVPVGSGSITG